VPAIEWLIISCSIIGSLCSTSIAGLLADKYGRHTILFIAGVLYLLGGCGMFITPNIYVLIAFRFVVGCAYGLSATVVPLLIAETSPSHIRGKLATFPQRTNAGGTFSGYCMAFLFSRGNATSWRVMTATLMDPSIFYVTLCLFYISESPRQHEESSKTCELKYFH
jgi:MFS family permease